MNEQQKLIALAAWNTVTCFACSLALAVNGDTAFSYITLALAVASSTDLIFRIRRPRQVKQRGGSREAE